MLSKRRKTSHDGAAVKAPSTKITKGTKAKSKAQPAPAPKEPPAPAPVSDDEDENDDENKDEDESSTIDNGSGEGKEENGESAPKSFQDLVCDTIPLASPIMVTDSPGHR